MPKLVKIPTEFKDSHSQTPYRSHYVQSMEERIAQMEKALKCLPLGQEMPLIGGSFKSLIEEQASLSHERSTHIVKSDGETDFIGTAVLLTRSKSESFHRLWADLEIDPQGHLLRCRLCHQKVYSGFRVL